MKYWYYIFMVSVTMAQEVQQGAMEYSDDQTYDQQKVVEDVSEEEMNNEEQKRGGFFKKVAKGIFSIGATPLKVVEKPLHFSSEKQEPITLLGLTIDVWYMRIAGFFIALIFIWFILYMRIKIRREHELNHQKSKAEKILEEKNGKGKNDTMDT